MRIKTFNEYIISRLLEVHIYGDQNHKEVDAIVKQDIKDGKYQDVKAAALAMWQAIPGVDPANAEYYSNMNPPRLPDVEVDAATGTNASGKKDGTFALHTQDSDKVTQNRAKQAALRAHEASPEFANKFARGHEAKTLASKGLTGDEGVNPNVEIDEKDVDSTEGIAPNLSYALGAGYAQKYYRLRNAPGKLKINPAWINWKKTGKIPGAK